MKWSLSWLKKNARPSFTFKEKVEFEKDFIKEQQSLLDLKDVIISGKGIFQEHSEHLVLNLTISGTMIVPCAHSLEPVEYDFTSDVCEEFTFDMESTTDAIKVKNELDITPLVWDLIVLEIPLRVIKEGVEIQKSGASWEVITEDQLKARMQAKENEIDPRLAKLQEFYKKNQ